VLPLLSYAGRLLLEYNESTGKTHRTLTTTARALTDAEFDIVVTYGGIVVTLAGEGRLWMPVRELRYNAALQARVQEILRHVQRHEIEPAEALDRLQGAETQSPPHSRWLTVPSLGLAASCLAVLVGADWGTILVAGLATSLGLVVRQELGRRHLSLLTVAFAGGFVGAVLGGLAIRLGWTHTPELALIVPSLILVPGPHLINGLLDLVDNYVTMGLARLGLAASRLVAIALGVVVGVELILQDVPWAEEAAKADHLNLVLDALLAGIVTIGFALVYNTGWSHVGLATVGGMAGHGLRFLALEGGWALPLATFVGGAAVGAVSTWVVRSYKVPFAVIAFAGAVTMMPGLQIYRALSGALRLARLDKTAGLPLVAETLGDATQACLVVIALSVGLIVAPRVVLLLAGEPDGGKPPSIGSDAT
jgi:uncharacterized membrane protein YjjP (DUF1212 family)